ncbi:HAMP domain-containing protein [Thauera mechernichensis]
MFRPSFRSIMLTAFLLIAGVLAAAAVSGWLSLEALARSIHDGKRNALALTAASRVLGERSVDLERSARQYLVLGEPALRQRFDDALSEAHLALDTLEASAQGLAAPVGEWRALAAAIERGLETTPDGSGTQAAADFSADFLALSQVSEAVERTIQARLARESEDLLAELEYRRHLLAQHILAAVALAGVLAALTSWWLLRPLARMERAIAALGDNHLESPIRIGGPADLRQLGEHLDWLRQRLAELEANRNRVLRHVSHELKTPLASLREGVALLSDGILGRTQRRTARSCRHPGQQCTRTAGAHRTAPALQRHPVRCAPPGPQANCPAAAAVRGRKRASAPHPGAQAGGSDRG